ncbi:MAG TPA: hypothetical protein VGN00_00520 [Puia sp.]|jgi:hypothetical protein
MKKENWSLLFILSASVLLSLLYIPGFGHNPLSGDKEVYRYIGQVIRNGGVPYRDAFDHKPPLIFFLNYAALLLGGDWGQWLIDTCLALLATGAFFQLCRKYKLPYPWLLPLLFNLMIRDFYMCLGMGMTREYTSMLLLIFFCVLLGKYRYHYFLMGLLSGLVFFTQQDQVLCLVPFFLYAFLPEQDTVPFLTRLARTAAGFLAIALPVILYFVLHNALKDFWQDAFLFNLTWYTTTLKASFGDHLRKLKLIMDGGNYEVVSLVSVVLGVCAVIFPNTNRKLTLASLAAVVLSIIPEFMGGRDLPTRMTGMSFTHYFLPLSASLSILLFCVFAFSAEPALQGRRVQVIYGILICCSLSYTAIRFATHRPLDGYGRDIVTCQEMYYLRAHKPKDDQLFVFGSTDYLYAFNEFRITGPSKWIYQHFYTLYDHWDNDHAILYSIRADLSSHKTTYVIDCTSSSWFRDTSAYKIWNSFLLEHYQPVNFPDKDKTDTLAQLWKLKGIPD